MVRLKWVIGIVVVCLGALTAPVLAQEKEHGGQEHGGATAAPSAPATEEHGGQTTPTPAPVAPPALKPITITFSGEVSAVNATDNPPMITVTDRYGVKKEISVPAEAKITAGTASKALLDLKAGDKVTVEYTYDVATGKRTAQNISIGEAAPAGT